MKLKRKVILQQIYYLIKDAVERALPSSNQFMIDLTNIHGIVEIMNKAKKMI